LIQWPIIFKRLLRKTNSYLHFKNSLAGEILTSLLGQRSFCTTRILINTRDVQGEGEGEGWGQMGDLTELYRNIWRQNRLSGSFVPFLNLKLKPPQRGGTLATQSTPAPRYAPEIRHIKCINAFYHWLEQLTFHNLNSSQLPSNSIGLMLTFSHKVESYCRCS